jgi:4-hydroxybenzoate polyprenyltransferase
MSPDPDPKEREIDNVYPDKVPLCVDLDDSLAKSDLLFEALAYALRYEPVVALLFILKLLMFGKAEGKLWLANNSSFSVDNIPLRPEVLELLQSESAKSDRLIYLVTASPTVWAESIAKRVGIFKESVGSSTKLNLKGEQKAAYLVDRFGEGGFDYLGDSRADLAVWRRCRLAYVVGHEGSFVDEVRSVAEVDKIIPGRAPYTFLLLGKALRVHQWIKNILIFLPIVAAHRFGDIVICLKALLAFIAFSLVASAVYLLNDICDLQSDRLHRTKHARPLASTDLKVVDGLSLIPVLVAGAMFLLLSLPIHFSLVLIAYLVMTTLYSFWLKRRAMVDIVVLSGLYTVRIVAGASATAIPVSTWLFSFSMFFFFSLACAKRFGELASKDEQESRVPGRGYYYGDRELIGQLGVASGVTSVLVLALYVTAFDVMKLYHHPALLLLTCPLVLLWISRIWLTAFRDELHDDPIVHALQYKGSYIIGFAFMVILMIAK